MDPPEKGMALLYCTLEKLTLCHGNILSGYR